MKIGIIASLYDPYTRGGAEVVAETVASELKKIHDIFVITTDEWRGLRSLLPRAEWRHGVRVYRFYPLNLFSFISINKKSFYLRAIWSAFDLFNIHSILVVRSILLREKPDCVFAHALKGLSYGIATLLNALKLQWVFTPHDVQLVVPSGRLLSGKKGHRAERMIFARLYQALTRLIIGSPPIVVCASRFLEQFYRTRGFYSRSEIAVIHNPQPEIPAVPVRQRSTKIFLFVGNLEAYKGVGELLAAFRSFSDPEARLSIIGTGTLTSDVQAVAAADSRIRYLGRVDGHEKFERIAESGYLVTPSLVRENLPTTIIESLSLGVPVLTSVDGGEAELVKDGVSGYHLRPDADGIRECLERAVSNKCYEAFSAAAKTTVVHLTPDWYCRSIFALLQLKQENADLPISEQGGRVSQ